MTNKVKIVLMAQYYFPPYAGVSLRPIKFCKYLPHYGWKPWVFSIDPRYYRGRVVEKLPQEAAEIQIFRIPYFDFPGNTVILKLLFPLLILAYVLRHRSQIGCVFLSGTPFYPFPLTAVLNGLLKIPAIIDFRDSWSINHGYDGRQVQGYTGKFRQWFYGLLEKVAIRFASSVIFASLILQQEYAQIFPEYQGKYKTITNGYDPEDINAVQPKRLVNNKTLILAGQFHVYTPDAVSYLLQALKTVPSLHFVYIGSEHAIFQNAAVVNGVEAQVTIFPFKPYREVLDMIAGSDYALLSTGLQNLMGTKTFDYLALNKPTLCLVPKGSVITQQLGGLKSIVICEPPYSLEVIKQALTRLLTITENEADRIVVAKFSRKETAGELANLLDEAINR